MFIFFPPFKARAAEGMTSQAVKSINNSQFPKSVMLVSLYFAVLYISINYVLDPSCMNLQVLPVLQQTCYKVPML